MHKQVSQDRQNRAPAFGAAVSVAIAAAGSVLVILLAGYITVQLQLVEAHGFLGFNDRFVSVDGDWLRYIWPTALIGLVVAAALVYRAVVRGTVARLTILGVFTLVALLAIPMASGPRLNPDESYPLVTYVVVEGAKSPMLFALIGVLVADLIAAPRRARPRQASF